MGERGNSLLRILDRGAGIPLTMALGAVRRRRGLPARPGSIGLFVFGAIGDTLLASALLAELARQLPGARRTIFTSKNNHGVLELLEELGEVVPLPIGNPLAALAAMRGHGCDVLVDTSPWPRVSAVLAALGPMGFTVGFRTPGQCRHWAYDAAVEHRDDRHELENFRALLGPLGIRDCRAAVPLRRDMGDLPAGLPGSYVVFHPWAEGFRCELREWPLDRWVDLGRELFRRGLGIVITGSKKDAPRAVELAGILAQGGPVERVAVLAGRTSLRGTAAALLRAAAVVSINTGTMHLAALLNCPLVALHGPTNPLRWGPLGSRSVVVGPGREAGCGYLSLGFEYPRRPPECMGRVSVDAVLERLGEMLATG